VPLASRPIVIPSMLAIAPAGRGGDCSDPAEGPTRAGRRHLKAAEQATNDGANLSDGPSTHRAANPYPQGAMIVRESCS
jgi:hypothetical protein